MIKNCLNCKKEFRTYLSRVKVGKGKFCTKRCANENKKGKATWNSGLTGKEYKKHYKNGFKGIFTAMDWAYGGGRKEYMKLHYWVRKNLGKASKCSVCNATKSNRRIDWANVSGEYKKDLKDWKQLCVKCHYEYDNWNERRLLYG